jgi:hypothetical protein
MDKRILKAYERYDYNGRVVPGSLVLRDRKPKNGKWKEVTGYECCNDIIPSGFRMFVDLSTSGDISFQLATGIDPTNLEFTILWGDGTPPDINSVAPEQTAGFEHTYTLPGVYTIEIIITSPSKNLTRISIANQNITEITGFSEVPNLAVLDVLNCPITSIDLGTLNYLTACTVAECPLSSFTFTSLPLLSSLVLSDTNISGTVLSGKSLPNLIEFEGINCPINNIDLSGLPDLYLLRLMGCAITNSTDIDNIFIGILANDRTGGVIDVSGGTNAAPTAASAAARATLASIFYDYYLAYN